MKGPLRFGFATGRAYAEDHIWRRRGWLLGQHFEDPVAAEVKLVGERDPCTGVVDHLAPVDGARARAICATELLEEHACPSSVTAAVFRSYRRRSVGV